jgi:tetratricopeptide (TPR) repeat protein
LLGAGKFEEALTVSQHAVEIDSSSPMSYRYKGVSLGRLGRYEEAIVELQTALRLSDRHQWILADLAWVYAQVQNREGIQDILDELLRRAQSEFVSSLFIGAVYYYAGHIENTFSYVRKSLEEKESQLACCRTKLWPLKEDMRNDPRFLQIVEALNFPPP